MPLYSATSPLPLNRKIFRHKASSPIPTTELSLWLKADAGTTTVAEQFISQIILSDAGTPEVNGTYTRASGGETSFSSSNGLSLDFLFSEPAEFGGTTFRFRVFFEEEPMYDVVILYDEIDSISALDGEAPDPTANTSLTATGNTLITTWADQSGNNNNAITLAIAPTFIASSINSKPAISFNGDGSWLQVPENIIGNEGNISIFVVLNYVSGLAIFNKGDLATYEATVWEMTTSNGFGFVDDIEEDPFWNVVPISVATNTPLLLEAFSSEGGSQVAFNGTNSGDPCGANNSFNDISQYIGIGGGGTNGSNQGNPLNAIIAEIIIYNREVSTPERQQVEAYLNTKYAIY